VPALACHLPVLYYGRVARLTEFGYYIEKGENYDAVPHQPARAVAGFCAVGRRPFYPVTVLHFHRRNSLVTHPPIHARTGLLRDPIGTACYAPNSAPHGIVRYVTRFTLRLGCLLFVLILSWGCARQEDAPTASAGKRPASAAVPPVANPAPPTLASEPTSGAAGVTQKIAPGLGAEIEQYLATAVAGEPFQGALLVARAGEVLVSGGYGMEDSARAIPNRPDTKFRLGSITKPFTALAVLMLQAQGRLDVQAPVCRYLDECPAPWRAITLHHLLSHTSGIPDLERFPDFPTFVREAATPLATVARFAAKPLDFPAGEGWEYSSSNYILLGVVIERASGQRYEDYLHEQILMPLAMSATGYDHNLDTLAVGYRTAAEPAEFIHMSVPFAAGGLYSTVEDLYKLDRALYGDQLLSNPWRTAMFTVQGEIRPEDPSTGYGYGWLLLESPQGSIAEHAGAINGYSAKIRRYLDQDSVIIVLSNQERRNPNVIVDGLAAILFQ
jgi:CubicO group peptidase (beta-lactamase class C family)